MLMPGRSTRKARLNSRPPIIALANNLGVPLDAATEVLEAPASIPAVLAEAWAEAPAAAVVDADVELLDAPDPPEPSASPSSAGNSSVVPFANRTNPFLKSTNVPSMP